MTTETKIARATATTGSWFGTGRKNSTGWVLPDLGRYVLMGGTAAGLDYLLFVMLSGGTALHPNLCNLISRPIAGLVSFLLHRHVTFQNRGASPLPTQFGRFWTIWIGSFLVSNLFLAFYFQVLGWLPAISKIGAEGAAGLFSFLGNRHWTFRSAIRHEHVGLDTQPHAARVSNPRHTINAGMTDQQLAASGTTGAAQGTLNFDGLTRV